MHSYFYNPFPVIDLGDIALRELTEDDAQNYFDYMSKTEMAPFLTDSNRPNSLQEALEEVQYWQSLFRNKKSFYWGIVLKETNQLIGTAGFNIIYFQHRKAEISYDLNSDFWGKGIMLKSVKNVLRFADLALSLVRVQATVTINNVASIKLLERCSFAREGTLKKYEVIDGEHRDYYMYARVN